MVCRVCFLIVRCVCFLIVRCVCFLIVRCICFLIVRCVCFLVVLCACLLFGSHVCFPVIRCIGRRSILPPSGAGLLHLLRHGIRSGNQHILFRICFFLCRSRHNRGILLFALRSCSHGRQRDQSNYQAYRNHEAHGPFSHLSHKAFLLSHSCFIHRSTLHRI